MNETFLSLLVQSVDGEDVETKLQERFTEEGIPFCRICSGYKSEFSCVLYIDGLQNKFADVALKVISDEFEILSDFDAEAERGGMTTNAILQQPTRARQHSHTWSGTPRITAQPNEFPHDKYSQNDSVENN